MVLPKYKTVIFMNGCFWHHHDGCHLTYILKTRTDFWIKKFCSNQVSDKLHRDTLEFMGWKVITIWECELKKDFIGVMERVTKILVKHKAGEP